MKEVAGFGKNYRGGKKGERSYVDGVVGFCLVVKKEVIEKVEIVGLEVVVGNVVGGSM